MPTTSAFAAGRTRSWSGLCLHPEPKPLGAPVSSLYTFPDRGLARRWHRMRSEAFADFTGVLTRRFPAARPVIESPALTVELWALPLSVVSGRGWTHKERGNH